MSKRSAVPAPDAKAHRTAGAIKKSLYELVSIESVARVVWTTERREEIRAELVLEVGASEANALCDEVNRHIVALAFAHVASEVEKPGKLQIRAVLIALNGVEVLVRDISGSVSGAGGVGNTDPARGGTRGGVHEAEMLYVRAMAHSALHHLLDSRNIDNAYADAFKMLSKANHVNQPPYVSNFRTEIDNFIKRCAQIGLNNGRKEMAIEAAQFEAKFPVASLVADLRFFVASNCIVNPEHSNNQQQTQPSRQNQPQLQQVQQPKRNRMRPPSEPSPTAPPVASQTRRLVQAQAQVRTQVQTQAQAQVQPQPGYLARAFAQVRAQAQPQDRRLPRLQWAKPMKTNQAPLRENSTKPSVASKTQVQVKEEAQLLRLKQTANSASDFHAKLQQRQDGQVPGVFQSNGPSKQPSPRAPNTAKEAKGLIVRPGNLTNTVAPAQAAIGQSLVNASQQAQHGAAQTRKTSQGQNVQNEATKNMVKVNEEPVPMEVVKLNSGTDAGNSIANNTGKAPQQSVVNKNALAPKPENISEMKISNNAVKNTTVKTPVRRVLEFDEPAPIPAPEGANGVDIFLDQLDKYKTMVDEGEQGNTLGESKKNDAITTQNGNENAKQGKKWIAFPGLGVGDVRSAGLRIPHQTSAPTASVGNKKKSAQKQVEDVYAVTAQNGDVNTKPQTENDEQRQSETDAITAQNGHENTEADGARNAIAVTAAGVGPGPSTGNPTSTESDDDDESRDGRFSMREDVMLRNGLKLFGWGNWVWIAEHRWDLPQKRTAYQIRNRAWKLRSSGVILKEDYPGEMMVISRGNEDEIVPLPRPRRRSAPTTTATARTVTTSSTTRKRHSEKKSCPQCDWQNYPRSTKCYDCGFVFTANSNSVPTTTPPAANWDANADADVKTESPIDVDADPAPAAIDVLPKAPAAAPAPAPKDVKTSKKRRRSSDPFEFDVNDEEREVEIVPRRSRRRSVLQMRARTARTATPTAIAQVRVRIPIVAPLGMKPTNHNLATGMTKHWHIPTRYCK